MTTQNRNNLQKSIFAQNSPDKSMESRLTVKNFGPIKNVELDLRNVNVFIGPQSSGKSALAKIYTIVKAPRKFNSKVILDSKSENKNITYGKNEFETILEEYNLKSFLKPNTEIRFESVLHTFEYVDSKVSYNPKLFKTIQSIESLCDNFDKCQEEIRSAFKKLHENFLHFRVEANFFLLPTEQDRTFSLDVYDLINHENYSGVIEIIKKIEEYLSTNTSIYIPAERSFINIIQNSVANLILNKVPIPKHILSFAAELEKLQPVEIELDFIQKDLKYKKNQDKYKLYISETENIDLTEAASGIQSVVPILLFTLGTKGLNHRSFVIEEPELNLFPTAQYELIQHLESNRREALSEWEDFGTIHTYTTHSPYVLSALNNLLYAFKAKQNINHHKTLDDQQKEILLEELNKIIKAPINPKNFTAYQIKDGSATSIFDRDAGLIDENFIDEASDKINDDFDKLMDLLK